MRAWPASFFSRCFFGLPFRFSSTLQHREIKGLACSRFGRIRAGFVNVPGGNHVLSDVRGKQIPNAPRLRREDT